MISTWKSRGLPGLLIAGLLVAGCAPEKTSVNFGDALSELQTAIDYKAKQCGNQPASPLIPPREVEEHALRVCSITIIRSACPFTEYPLFCTGMFFDLAGISK